MNFQKTKSSLLRVLNNLISHFGVQIVRTHKSDGLPRVGKAARQLTVETELIEFNTLSEIMELEIPIGDNKYPLLFRRNSLGDVGAINQIFSDKDYDTKQWHQGRVFQRYFESRSSSDKFLIIDAGANIGSSALYFLASYPGVKLYAIEPDRRNSELLSLNVSRFEGAKVFKGAISSSDGELILNDPGLSDWGFRTSTKSDSKHERGSYVVPSICPTSILSDPWIGDGVPLIFKIDIEGAESDLFTRDVQWMTKFALIIIELHDWMLPFQESSKSFFVALARFDFDVVYRGENMFLFNRSILGKEDSLV
jgi:FkbM family methyltransferase